MINSIWYLTVVLSVWGWSFGGIPLPGIGTIYPFRILLPILAVILFFRSKKSDWGIDRHTWLTILPLSAFMLLHGALSILWSADRMTTLKAVMNLGYILLFLLVFFRIAAKNRSVLHNTLLALSANMAAILLFALFECLSGKYLFSAIDAAAYGQVTNPFGFHCPAVCFQNTNNLAFNIVMTTPIMLFAADELLKIGVWKKLLIKTAVILLSAFVILNTDSRLAYFGYPLVLLVYFFLRLRVKAVKIVIACVALVAVAGAGVFFADKMIGKIPKPASGTSTVNSFLLHIHDRSARMRATMIVKALRVVRDTYGLGQGAKNSEQLVKSYTDLPQVRITAFHQFYGELAAEYGVLPFAFFVMFQVLSLIMSVRLYRRSSDNRNLAICCIAGNVGFIVASFFCSSAMFLYIMWIQFALWSFAMGAGRVNKA